MMTVHRHNPIRTLFERLMGNGDPFVDQLDRNAKTLLKGALTRLDVVSREEFDAQTAVLRRTRERLEQLERDLAIAEPIAGFTRRSRTTAESAPSAAHF